MKSIIIFSNNTRMVHYPDSIDIIYNIFKHQIDGMNSSLVTIYKKEKIENIYKDEFFGRVLYEPTNFDTVYNKTRRIKETISRYYSYILLELKLVDLAYFSYNLNFKEKFIEIFMIISIRPFIGKDTNYICIESFFKESIINLMYPYENKTLEKENILKVNILEKLTINTKKTLYNFIKLSIKNVNFGKDSEIFFYFFTLNLINNLYIHNIRNLKYLPKYEFHDGYPRDPESYPNLPSHREYFRYILKDVLLIYNQFDIFTDYRSDYFRLKYLFNKRKFSKENEALFKNSSIDYIYWRKFLNSLDENNPHFIFFKKLGLNFTVFEFQYYYTQKYLQCAQIPRNLNDYINSGLYFLNIYLCINDLYINKDGIFSPIYNMKNELIYYKYLYSFSILLEKTDEIIQEVKKYFSIYINFSKEKEKKLDAKLKKNITMKKLKLHFHKFITYREDIDYRSYIEDFNIKIRPWI